MPNSFPNDGVDANRWLCIMTATMAAQATISFPNLVAGLEKLFMATGVADWAAQVLARNCATCERDGTLSHRVFRMPGYLLSLRADWVNGQAEHNLEQVGPSFLQVDARNGFAQTAKARASLTVGEMLAQTGLTMVALRDSHHFNPMWPDAEPWAERGYFAFSLVTAGPTVMPFGAQKPLFGTNPIAFATPVQGKSPLVFDFTTARMSQGDIRLAQRSGKRLPTNTGIDSQGRPTDDPAEVVPGGGILPFGGHKRAALSLMPEISASAFTDGPLGHEVDWSTPPGAETPRTGQFFLIANPKRGQNVSFAARIAGMVDLLHLSGAARLPGLQRGQIRAKPERDRIPVSAEMRHVLLAFGVKTA